MDWRHWIDLLPISGQLDPLLIFGLVLVCGAAGGWLARIVHLPAITGNILAGVLIGPSVLGIVSGEETIAALRPLSSFAMGLITVAIGGHLSYRRIHNALRRIILISLFEVTTVVVLVTLVTHWLGADWTVALLLGALSAATAPATIVAIIRETRSKGTYVKTLLSVVAMDNILAITLFVIIRTILVDFHADGSFHLELGETLVQPLWQLIGAILFGLLLGRITDRMVRKPQFHNFSTVFVAILLAMGLSTYLGMSPLLTCLFFGVYLGNSSPEVEEQLEALEPIKLLLFICFFTLAGVTIHVQALSHMGLLGAGYILARIVGKGLGAAVGGILAGSSRRIWENIPLGLVPQAGLAIALVVLLMGDPEIDAATRQMVGTLVLAAVVINEFIGPICTRMALRRAKEVDKDRPRLIEFLQEEFILTDMEPRDKWDAIGQLCDFLIRTHRVEHIHPDELYRSVIERERIEPTGIGNDAAIPHGIIDKGPSIQGVLGICKRPVDFGNDDVSQPVRLIMLIVTPREHHAAHLKVMASLAHMIRSDIIRSRLMAAIDPNDAWEVIEDEETPDFNDFLED